MLLEKELSVIIKKDSTSSLVELVKFLIEALFIYDKKKDNSLYITYSSVSHLIEGNNKEDETWMNYLSSGNYFENYKPGIKNTTGLNLGIDLNSKTQTNFDFDKYGIITLTDLNERKFSKMNDLLTLNIKKKDYDFTKNEFSEFYSPIFNYELLLGTRKFSDGFQYHHELSVIYYYDSISSRALRFQNKGEKKYKDKIQCKNYELEDYDESYQMNEKLDLNEKYALITQRTNKPYVIMKNGESNADNYICLDTVSDMVIDSNINLIYGMYSRKYGYINNRVKNNYVYPVFKYQRKYEVDIDSYEKQFIGVTEYYENYIVIIIIGVIFFAFFTTTTIISFVYLKKKYKNDLKVQNDEEELLPVDESEAKKS
jgi:hypothetical protein